MESDIMSIPITEKNDQWGVTLLFKLLPRNHSRYDFGNSRAPKRRDYEAYPLGETLEWQKTDKEKKENVVDTWLS